MSFLAPAFLAAAGLAAAAVVAFHYFSTRRPPPAPLPTARFVPDRAARATSRARRPADLVLLALRVLALLLAGAAFAGPVARRDRRAVARVIVADRSRAVRDPAEVRDSVRALRRAGDVVVAFDSTPRVLAAADEALDTALGRSDVRGSLSPALVLALREAARLRDAADSAELVIVSPLAAEEVDAATASVRALWRGRARLAAVAARTDDALASVIVRAAGGTADDDPVAAGAARFTSGIGREGGRAVRIARDAPTRADSLWARDSGGVLVAWPTSGAPAGWAARDPADAPGGVVTASASTVAPFGRVARAPTNSVRASIVARWPDGEAAAVERALGRGCLREVGVAVPAAGDVTLRDGFRALLAALVAPCGGARGWQPAGRALVAALGAPGPLLATSTLPAPARARTSLTPWLLGAALCALIGEMLVRRRVSFE